MSNRITEYIFQLQSSQQHCVAGEAFSTDLAASGAILVQSKLLGSLAAVCVVPAGRDMGPGTSLSTLSQLTSILIALILAVVTELRPAGCHSDCIACDPAVHEKGN